MRVFFSATWVHTLSSSMVNDLRLAYRRVNENYPLKQASANSFPYLEIGSVGLALGPDPNFPQGSPVNNSYQIYEAFSYVKGTHSFKFGGESRQVIFSTNFVQAVRGSYIYDDLDQLLTDQVPRDAKSAGRLQRSFCRESFRVLGLCPGRLEGETQSDLQSGSAL
jgi:hypothetical protein